MHVVTGISFFLLGIASIVAVKVLVKFQLRTLQLFGFSELFRDRFAIFLKWGWRLFGLVCNALGLIIAFTGYL